MAMKEVKLTINVEGILKKCQSMDRNDASITSVRTISHMNMLKRIIKNNLKIESKELSEQKKETILKIIKNNIFQHLTYSLNEDSTMRTMVYELLSGDEEDVKCVFISLANTLINPDPLIYNPEHGINRQFDTHRKMIDSVDLSRGELDLSARTCTLMVDDTSLENILQLTSESLDRENAFFVSNSMRPLNMNLFKKYTSVKGRYSLDDLYTQEKDKVPLIDYGLKLIHEKYHLIEGLIEDIKEIESSDNNKVQDIPAKLSNLFKNKELEVVFSILNNKGKIILEKMVYIPILKALDCMATSTDLLGGKGEQKVLKIKTGLSNFSEDYITSCNGLLEIMSNKVKKLRDENESMTKSVDIEKEKWSKKEKSLKEWKTQLTLIQTRRSTRR